VHRGGTAVAVKPELIGFYGAPKCPPRLRRTASSDYGDIGSASNLPNSSLGVRKPRVWRGRPFNSAATLARAAWEYKDRPVPLGEVPAKQAVGVLVGAAPPGASAGRRSRSTYRRRQ